MPEHHTPPDIPPWEPGPTTNVGGGFVDCQVTIVGWFQISGNIDVTTGEFLPETGIDGVPVSGPGWVAYQKTGAQPGDIVIIYQVQTMSSTLTSGPLGQGIAGVLWDILDPCGVSFFTTDYSMKSCVLRNDLISNLPHAGGGLTPINPVNPFGDADILWRNVTTYYGLPGPGNQLNPYFIKFVLPLFGIRLLLWSDSCCTHNILTPMINTSEPLGWGPGGGPSPGGGVGPGPPTTNPNPNPPTTTVVNPGTAGGSTLGTVDPPASIIVGEVDPPDASSDPPNIPVEPNEPPLPPGVGSGGANPPVGSPPPIATPTPVEPGGKGRKHRRPGHAPLKRNVNRINQVSYYNVAEGSPDVYHQRLDPADFALQTRAVRVGARALWLREGLAEHHQLLLTVDKITWKPSLPIEQLRGLGLAGGEIGEASSSAWADSNPVAPGGKTGRSQARPNRSVRGGITPNQKTITADPVRDRGDGSQLTNEQTRGGFSTFRKLDANDMPAKLPNQVPGTTGQLVSYRNRKSKPRASKSGKLTQRGGELRAGIDRGGLVRRAPTVGRGSTVAARVGSEQSKVMRNNRLSLSNYRRTTEPIKFETVDHPAGRYKVTPLRISSGNGMTYVVVIEGRDIDAVREDVQLVTTAQITYPGGESDTVSIGSTGFITMGITNPPQAGQYVIANPVCTPGAGSLPTILADGQQWSFLQLVFALLDIESNVISQQVINFLPSPPGATDVQAPNRLPVGLMSDLDMADTSVPLYDGTFSHQSADANTWFLAEPSVVVEKVGPSSNTATVVLKATVNGLGQTPPFSPVMEMYNNDLLISSQNPLTSFIGGPCGALPGWYAPGVGAGVTIYNVHTACPGSSGFGGAGGTSAFFLDSVGMAVSGPYNPAMYGGTHHNFLCFKGSDATIIQAGTAYRIRVYNNGPANELNGYALYTANLAIKEAQATLSIDANGDLSGNVKTYHCSQTLRIRNVTTGAEIERYSAWQDGTIDLSGAASSAGGGITTQFLSEARLAAQPGDVIRIFRPGYDNNYASETIVLEVILE